MIHHNDKFAHFHKKTYNMNYFLDYVVQHNARNKGNPQI